MGELAAGSEARYPSEGVRMGDGVGGSSAFLPGETSRPPRTSKGGAVDRKDERTNDEGTRGVG